MKRMTTILVASLILISLTACSQEDKGASMTTNNSQTSPTVSSSTPSSAVEHGQIEENSTNLSQANQDAIIARYEEMQEALVNQDVTTLNQLLPDDYVAVHITGRRQTKEEWLKDIEDGEMRYFKFSDVHYTLSQEGDRVFLQVRQRITANIYGSESTWSIPGTREFEKKDGQWEIVG